jgi:hypothetical protein
MVTSVREAVKAVPHREHCADQEYLACTCDRDERIAKGIEAVMEVSAHWEAPLTEPFMLEVCVDAFSRAAAL